MEKVIHIDKMICFGSRVREDHLKQSDFDIIIVLKDFEGKKFITRPVQLYAFWRFDEPVELLCYTPTEFERKIHQISTIREAIAEGLEI